MFNIGFGVVVEKLNDFAYERLYEMMMAAHSEILWDFLSGHEAEEFSKFCDKYEDETNLATGLPALLANFIDEQEFNSDGWMTYEDGVIHVPLFIPRESTRNSCPTIEQVEEIAQKYIAPILKGEDCICDYHTIRN